MVIKNLPGLDPEPDSAKHQDQGPDSINPDPQRKVSLAFLIQAFVFEACLEVGPLFTI